VSQEAAIEAPAVVPQLLANPTAQPSGRIEIVLADGTAEPSRTRRSMNWPCAMCWRYCADDQLAIRCTRVAGLRPDRYAQLCGDYDYAESTTTGGRYTAAYHSVNSA